jgi:hypothetical protein
MPVIPPPILRKLYVDDSLQAEESGFRLQLQNTLAPAVLVDFQDIRLNEGRAAPEQVTVTVGDERRPATSITEERPLSFALGEMLWLRAEGVALAPGRQELEIGLVLRDVGAVRIPVTDDVG